MKTILSMLAGASMLALAAAIPAQADGVYNAVNVINSQVGGIGAQLASGALDVESWNSGIKVDQTVADVMNSSSVEGLIDVTCGNCADDLGQTVNATIGQVATAVNQTAGGVATVLSKDWGEVSQTVANVGNSSSVVAKVMQGD